MGFYKDKDELNQWSREKDNLQEILNLLKKNELSERLVKNAELRIYYEHSFDHRTKYVPAGYKNRRITEKRICRDPFCFNHFTLRRVQHLQGKDMQNLMNLG